FPHEKIHVRIEPRGDLLQLFDRGAQLRPLATLLSDAFELEPERGQALPQLVMQLTRDAAALVLLCADDAAHQFPALALDAAAFLNLLAHGLVGFGQLAGAILHALVEFLPALIERLLLLPLRGQVARDLGVPAALAQGRHHATHVTALAIPADVPALINRPPLLVSHRPLLFGNPALPVLGREDDVNRLPLHLLLGVPEYPLGPLVPAGHAAFCVHQGDGVILRAIDHQAQPLLRFAQSHRHLAALGDVYEGDDDAADLVVHGAVRPGADDEPAPVRGHDFALDSPQVVEDLLRIPRQAVVVEDVREVGERAAQVAGDDIEQVLDARRVALDE